MRRKSWAGPIFAAAFLNGGSLLHAGASKTAAPAPASILTGKPVLIDDMMMPVSLAQPAPGLTPAALPAQAPQSWLQPSAAFDEEARAAAEGPVGQAIERPGTLLHETEALVNKLATPSESSDAAAVLEKIYDKNGSANASSPEFLTPLALEKMNGIVERIVWDQYSWPRYYGAGTTDYIHSLEFVLLQFKVAKGHPALNAVLENKLLRDKLDVWMNATPGINDDKAHAAVAAAGRLYRRLEALLPRHIVEERVAKAKAASEALALEEAARKARELSEKIPGELRGWEEKLLAANTPRQVHDAVADLARFVSSHYSKTDGLAEALRAKDAQGTTRYLDLSPQANALIRAEASKKRLLSWKIDASFLASLLPEIELPMPGNLSLPNGQNGHVSISAEAGKVSLGER